MLTALAFELAPALPSARQERHVAGVLVIRRAEDPRAPARRAERVTARETIEAEDVRAALRERVGGRAPVRAETRHDDVRLHGLMVPDIRRPPRGPRDRRQRQQPATTSHRPP